ASSGATQQPQLIHRSQQQPLQRASYQQQPPQLGAQGGAQEQHSATNTAGAAGVIETTG
ncbi:unnamed protein product, partial [Amoebophrya sp. A25]